MIYLGAFSLVLFCTLAFGADFILKPILRQENISFLSTVSEVFSQQRNQFLLTYQKAGAKPLDLSIIQQNSLRSTPPPNTVSSQVLGSLIGVSDELLDENEYQYDTDSKEILEYVVQSGDTISSVAEKFGISIETILWANNLTKTSSLRSGQKLIILPVSGVLYHVKKDDTLSNIAETYQAKTSEITAFNELSDEGDIYVGDILIIPNGVKPKVVAAAVPSIPLPSSYFMVPVSSPYIITQGLHWYNAIDFSHPGSACGKPVYAVAAGKIQKSGYDKTAGNYVRILHDNGVITMYGHLSSILVKNPSLGEEIRVSQGDIIGYIGNTGYSTGCHLHFEVRGAKNPFAN